MKWYHKVGLALLGLLGIVLALVSAGKVQLPMDAMKATIDAKAQAKRLEAEMGRDKAAAAIKKKYKKTLEKLDEEEREKVERLSGNPSKLAGALLRAGRKAAKRKV